MVDNTTEAAADDSVAAAEEAAAVEAVTSIVASLVAGLLAALIAWGLVLLIRRYKPKPQLDLKNTDIAGHFTGDGSLCSPSCHTIEITPKGGDGICVIQKAWGLSMCCHYACKCGKSCWCAFLTGCVFDVCFMFEFFDKDEVIVFEAPCKALRDSLPKARFVRDSGGGLEQGAVVVTTPSATEIERA